jgi:hypothetical protein
MTSALAYAAKLCWPWKSEASGIRVKSKRSCQGMLINDETRRSPGSLLENTYPLMQHGTQSQRYQVLLLLDHLMARYRPGKIGLGVLKSC